MRSFIIKVLEVLEDGGPHSLEEIAEKTSIPIDFVKKITGFLVKWGFAEYDEEKRRVKLKAEYLSLP